MARAFSLSLSRGILCSVPSPPPQQHASCAARTHSLPQGCLSLSAAATSTLPRSPPLGLGPALALGPRILRSAPLPGPGHVSFRPCLYLRASVHATTGSGSGSTSSFAGEIQRQEGQVRGQGQGQEQGQGHSEFHEPAPAPSPAPAPAFATAPGEGRGLLFAFLEKQQQQYLQANPTSRHCLDLVRAWQAGAPPHASAMAFTPGSGALAFDHLAFRTLGASGCGISSVASFLEDFGYQRRDALVFPKKKLRAFWFAPPPSSSSSPPSPSTSPYPATVSGRLPRVFVSELAVEELGAEAQAVILRYTQAASPVARHAFALSLASPLPWARPSSQDYLTLARESEYAAWTLANGYSLNHTTISVHQLQRPLGPDSGAASLDGPSASAPIDDLNAMLLQEGVHLNAQGGIVKVSPDGLLLQSSTVADSGLYTFSDGVSLEVPLSYVEFALRLVLPQFAHLPLPEIQEWHRRDGFEAGNADKIFESTSSTQAKNSMAA